MKGRNTSRKTHYHTRKETALLAIPEVCIDKIIALYHSSLVTGHQGVIKTYLTISDKFFIPGFIHYLHTYIKGCHICQLLHIGKPSTRQLQTRINLNYRLLSTLSMDLKVMPRSNKGHKYILCIIDEVTNYLNTIPIHQSRSEEIGNALIENVITKYCIPIINSETYISIRQQELWMSKKIKYEFYCEEPFMVKHKCKYGLCKCNIF